MTQVVVVGAGTSAGQLAIALRRKGFEGPITLIGDEDHPPYNRPPLSKAWLKELDAEPSGVALRPDTFWTDQGVAVVTGVRVTAIDRDGRRVVAEDGSAWSYDHLVLATGSRNRTLVGLPDALGLRTVADAREIRDRLGPGAALAVVGGGFVGLELAAAARHHGTAVSVVEAQERLMARALAPEAAAYLQAEHERHGVDVRLGRIATERDADGLVLDDGTRVAADAVVVGVGVLPNEELAAAAGLEVDDGVVVDRHLQTTDPDISAIGDCARHRCAVSGADLRLESVQNATDQAAHVAARLLGEATPYAAVPWFWTEQYGIRVQIAGVAGSAATSVVLGDVGSGAFSVARFDDGRLSAVDSLNRPADHMAARKLLAAGADLAPEVAAAPGFTLKAHLQALAV